MFPIASRGIYAPFNQVMGDAFLYWDANKTDTFTDLTTNGNNATQNTLGTGASITHNSPGSGSYWHFTTPDGSVGQPYAEVSSPTSFTMTPSGAMSWFTVTSVDSSHNGDNVTFRWGSSNDSVIYSAYDGPGDVGSGHWAAGMTQNTSSVSCVGSERIESTAFYNDDAWYINFYLYDPTYDRFYIFGNNSKLVESTYQFICEDVILDSSITIGLSSLSGTNEQNFKWGAGGFWKDKVLTAEERQSIIDYYQPIYGL